jgi:CheY-like chemotaxis protein
MTQRLVLVVGGDTQTQYLVKTALIYSTFSTASDAAHAWKVATTERPDIIVTDPAALAFEGSDLVRQLKGHPTTALIPVLGVTAQPHSEQQEDTSAAKCDALLMMPVTATTLGDVARLLIARQNCCGSVPHG